MHAYTQRTYAKKSSNNNDIVREVATKTIHQQHQHHVIWMRTTVLRTVCARGAKRVIETVLQGFHWLFSVHVPVETRIMAGLYSSWLSRVCVLVRHITQMHSIYIEDIWRNSLWKTAIVCHQPTNQKKTNCWCWCYSCSGETENGREMNESILGSVYIYIYILYTQSHTTIFYIICERVDMRGRDTLRAFSRFRFEFEFEINVSYLI